MALEQLWEALLVLEPEATPLPLDAKAGAPRALSLFFSWQQGAVRPNFYLLLAYNARFYYAPPGSSL